MAEAAGRNEAAVADDKLLRAALASMPYGFCVWDEDFRLVSFNDAYRELYRLPADWLRPGLTLREMAELTARLDHLDGLDADEIYARYRRRFVAQASGKVTEHRAGGRVVRSTVTRMPGLGWVATHQDITDEVAAQGVAAAREEALAHQNLRFDAAVNNMSHGLAMFGPDQRLVICNGVFAAMYGLSPELLAPGTTLTDILAFRVARGLVPEGERADRYVAKRLAMAAEHTRTVRLVERERGRTILVIQQPMADGGWVSTYQDITEQRRREELIQARTLELEVQNIRFDAALNNMLHGLCMFDGENRLIVCNRQYAEMYGLPPALTRPGTSFWDMLDDGAKTGMVSIADPEARFKVLNAVIDAGRPFKENIRMENGRVIAVLHQPMTGGGWISTHEDVTEQHEHQEMIRHMARHDALTDLPNRVLFREEMAKIEGRIKRQEKIAVLCVDLDHFKAVNDTLGHGVGDEVLMTVARRLREASRETDIVARLGGDEFAVLVGPLEHPKHAAIIADRIVKSIAAPMVIDDNRVMIGASVGIALAPTDGADAETLLKNADLALYRAKSGGRGIYHFFERGMDQALKQRRALEVALKGALQRNEFRLAYQPIISLAGSRICAVEALLRWEHPERGCIAPAEFIPLAEDTGAIGAIGEWVLAEACRAAAAWPRGLRLAVNLSPAQFRVRGLVRGVERALREAGLPAHRLELEVTEALLASGGEPALRTLRRLKELGVRIVMDDFGTGNGSLESLSAFPFDRVKVDCAWVAGLAGPGRSMDVVNAMIGLGQSLGMATTAKCIETEAQLDAVRRQGCEEGQGFLFSPPMPASGIDALLGTVRANEARRRDAG